MKKTLLQILLALLPITSFAQYGINWNQDFAGDDIYLKEVRAINDHQQIVTMNTDSKTFEVFPVDDKLNIPWRTSLDGDPLYSGPFRGHILVIANLHIKTLTLGGARGTYIAYLLDAKTGKQELRQEIFRQPVSEQELTGVYFSPDGSDFKLLVENYRVDKYRLAGVRETKIITDLSLVSLNEKLEPSTLQLSLPAENAIQLAFNKKGDLFLLTAQPGGFGLVRYEAGQSQPSVAITQLLTYRDDFNFPAALIGSDADRKICYFSFAYKTPDKEMALEIGKADFNKQSCLVTSETFEKATIKNIEKNTAPISKLLKETTFGWLEGLLPIHLEEYNGGLVITIAEKYTKSSATMSTMQTGLNSSTTSYGSSDYGVLSSFIIEYFDSQLKKNFQQALPNFASMSSSNNPHYIIKDGKLCFDAVTEYKNKVFPLFCELDLKTGVWVKTDLLLDREDKDYAKYHPLLNGTMWFNDSFAVPYNLEKGGLRFKYTESYELQQNKY
jgi:hypothetical protein